MGGRHESTFLQRRYIYGQQMHENMLNITHHQGNANPNYNEISLHELRRMAKIKNTHKKPTGVVKRWRKKKTYALFVGMQTGEAMLENSVVFPQKLKIELGSSNFTTGYLSKKKKYKNTNSKG